VQAQTTTRVRLAELVAALSLGIDLGFGQPMEHVLRQCLIALRLSEGVGLDEKQRVVVYYTALLVNVGCHADAHEQAKWFGDDIASKAIKYEHELRSLRMAVSGLRFLGSGHPPVHRFKLGLEFVLSGHREVDGMIEAHAAMARALGEQLGLQEEVLEALASRLAQLAEFAEVAHRVGGVDGVRMLLRKRRGKQFDPRLADLFDAEAEIILAGLDSTGTWDAVIDAEPALTITLTGERIDTALRAIANFVDLKSPYFLGHASAVSELAAATGAALGLNEEDVLVLRRAGLVHDLGRLGISNAIWDKPEPLGAGEWERLRLHPYLTERMLKQSPALAPLAAIAIQHRERLDGSGYPRGLSGAAISRPARILGAADAYQAMREPRPHRVALSAEQAAVELRADVMAGRYDGEVVEAVLGAAGHRVSRRYEGPAGLTAREIEVLRLLARGLSNKQIAQQLVISPKTVATHAEHIYAKINAPSRAAAGLYAMQHGLLPEEALA
jgi:DNA-binding CsgD family transcriptional regulator